MLLKVSALPTSVGKVELLQLFVRSAVQLFAKTSAYTLLPSAIYQWLAQDAGNSKPNHIREDQGGF